MISNDSRQHPSGYRPLKFRQLLVVVVASMLALACNSNSETEVTKSLSSEPARAATRSELEEYPEHARARAELLLASVEQAPDDANKIGQLAMFAHAYSLFEQAISRYEKAAQLAPDVVDWPYLSGVLLSEQGNNAAAISAFRQAASIDSNYPPLRLRLAQLLIKDQQFNEARSSLQALIHDVPNYAKARWAYGQFSFEQGDYETAIEQLNFAVAQVPHYGSAHYTLAAAYRAIGDTTNSEAHTELFKKYRHSGPASLDNLISRVENLRDTSQQVIVQAGRLTAAGKIPQAISVFNALLKEEPDHAVAHINLIGLYGQMGQFDKAEQHYRAGLKVAPEAVKLHNNYGVLMLKQKDYTNAAEAFRAAIQVDADYATPYKYLGLSLQNLGQAKEAQDYFRTAFEKDPQDDQVGYLLGNSLLLEKRYRESVEVLTKVATVQSPRSPRYLRTLAKAHVGMGNMDKALQALNQARTVANTFGQTTTIQQIDVEIEQVSNAGAAAP